MIKNKKWIVLLLIFGMLLLMGIGCKRKVETPDEEPPVVEENNGGENEGSEKPDTEVPKDPEEEEENNPVGIYPGNTAISLQLKNENDEVVSLEQFKGKPVIIVFWVTWSPEAMSQLEALNQVKQQYKEDIAILGIHSSAFDILDYQSTVSFIKDRNDAIEMLIDEKSEINSAYYISSYPTTYFIDSEGIVVKSVTTPMTKDQIIEEIKTSFYN